MGRFTRSPTSDALVPEKILPPRRSRTAATAKPSNYGRIKLEAEKEESERNAEALIVDEQTICKTPMIHRRRKNKDAQDPDSDSTKKVDSENEDAIEIVVDGYMDVPSTTPTRKRQKVDRESIPIPRWRIIEEIEATDPAVSDHEEDDIVEPSDNLIRSRHRISELKEKIWHNFGNQRAVKIYQRLLVKEEKNLGKELAEEVPSEEVPQYSRIPQEEQPADTSPTAVTSDSHDSESHDADEPTPVKDETKLSDRRCSTRQRKKSTRAISADVALSDDEQILPPKPPKLAKSPKSPKSPKKQRKNPKAKKYSATPAFKNAPILPFTSLFTVSAAKGFDVAPASSNNNLLNSNSDAASDIAPPYREWKPLSSSFNFFVPSTPSLSNTAMFLPQTNLAAPLPNVIAGSNAAASPSLDFALNCNVEANIAAMLQQDPNLWNLFGFQEFPPQENEVAQHEIEAPEISTFSLEL